jgi:flagellar biosynthesis protein FlhG
MTDQAAGLRHSRRRSPSGVASAGPPAFVVAGGKGGVGTSVVAALLAAGLSRKRRVLLFEAEQNLASLSVLLGVRPEVPLSRLAEGSAAPEDLLTPVTDRLWLLAGDSGDERLQSLGATDRARLHYQLSGLHDAFEAVVVDAGGGLEGVVRTAIIRASALLIVTVAEPSALTDAYALLKIVHLQAPSLGVGVMVNRVTALGEGEATFERLNTAARRFLEFGLEYLGAIPEDATLQSAVRLGRPLLEAAGGPAGATAATLAEACLAWYQESRRHAPPLTSRGGL